MYKDVAKRILASILIFCMIGSTPDLTLLAAEGGQTGATHTYSYAGTDKSTDRTVSDGGYIANAYTVEENQAGSEMNAQKLTSVAFELDRTSRYGDGAASIGTVDFTVDVYKYEDSALDVMQSAAADVTVTGTYNIADTDADGYYTVDLLEDQQLELGTGDHFAVKVTLKDALFYRDGDTAGTPIDKIYYATSANGNAESYADGASLSGRTAHIKAVTQEIATEVPVTSLEFKQASADMIIGETASFDVEFTPASASDRTLVWSSNNDQAASVDESTGEVTAREQGTAVIRAAWAQDETIFDTMTVEVCKDIADMQYSAIDNQTYQGKEITPGFDVKDGETPLGKTQYDVEYKNNKNVGTATVAVTGIGNGYAGSRELSFEIIPASMERSQIAAEWSAVDPTLYSYQGDEVEIADPARELTVTYTNRDGDKIPLTYAEDGSGDYKIKGYRDNDKAGNQAVVILEGTNNYEGTLECMFRIGTNVEADKFYAACSPKTAAYTGTKKKPAVFVTYDGAALKEGTDYTVTVPGDMIDAGTYTITVNGKGIYDGMQTTAEYTINPRNLTENMIELPNQLDTVMPDTIQGLEVTYAGTPLEKDQDYEIADVTVDPDTKQAAVTIRGIGNYGQTVIKTVGTGKDIAGCTITVDAAVYTGKAVTPKVTVTDASGAEVTSANYTLSWKNNTNAADENAADAPTVTLAGIGVYAGVTSQTFTIQQKDISELKTGSPAGSVTWEESVLYQKGKDAESEISLVYNGVALKEGNDSDYTVTYSNNKNVTTADQPAVITVTAAVDSNFKGSFTREYAIEKPSIGNETYMTFTPEEIPDQEWAGSPIEPAVEVFQNGVKLDAGTDYTVSYGGNEGIGDNASVILLGTGNYKGYKTIPFRITAPGIANAVVEGITSPMNYTGKAVTQSLTVKLTVSGTEITLTEGTDYTVDYADNTEAGTASITLTGIGNYTGTKTETFLIQKPLEASSMAAAIPAQTYAGKEVTPKVTLTDTYVDGTKHPLIEGEDYTLSYADNKGAVSQPSVTITGKNGYTGTITIPFTIQKGSLSNVDVALKYSAESLRRFTGSEIKPEIVVTCNGTELKETTDYVVTYENNINVSGVNGRPMVLLTEGSNFKGIQEFSFDIVSKNISDSSIQAQIAAMDAAELSAGSKPKAVIKDTARYSNGRSKNSTGGGSGDYELKEKKDYELGEVTFLADGQAEIEIIGINNYAGSFSEKFAVNQTELPQQQMSVRLPADQRSFVYSGEVVTPHPVVTAAVNGQTITLTEGTDYEVTATGAVNVGTYSCSIKCIGTYKGTYTAADTFEITKRDVASEGMTVDPIDNQVYTGSEVKPEITLRYNGKEIGRENYDLSYANNIEVNSTAVVTVTGKNNLEGTRTETFVIRQDISGELSIEGLEGRTFVYTSKPITPKVVVKAGSKTLIQDVDYTLSYQNNTKANVGVTSNPWKAYVVVTGMGSYAGTQKFPFDIHRKYFHDADIHVEVMDTEYTGGLVIPDAKITYTLEDGTVYQLKSQKDALAEGVQNDYFISVGSIRDADENKEIDVTITPSGINFYGDARTEHFKILPKSITDQDGKLLEDYVISSVEDIQYDAATVQNGYEPNIILQDRSRSESGEPFQEGDESYYKLKKDQDYTIVFSGNDRPGTATYTIKGMGNYSRNSVYTGTFKIKANISAATVSISDQTYTGSEITPPFTVSFGANMLLKNDVDYTYEFTNNINAGTAVLKIIGINSYAGSTKEQTFTIHPKDIGASDVTLTHMYQSYTYTGENIHPEPHFTYNGKKLAMGVDYTCTYPESCSKAGEWYYMTIEGKGNFSGELKKEYKIGDNYTEARVEVILADGYSFQYTGRPIYPTPKVTRKDAGHEGELLKANLDYMFEWEDNVDVGTAYVNTWGNPDGPEEYAGNISVAFEITPKSVEDDDIKVETVKPADFTGEAIEPQPTVMWNGRELIAGEDFEYVYQNNTDAGSARVTIKGMKNFTGEKTVDFTINRKDISAVGSGIDADTIPDQIYTGSEVKPVPVVRWGDKQLVLGSDYELSYEDNTELGSAAVTILGIGNYKGSITKNFNIIKVPVAQMNIEYQKSWFYTGNPIRPVIKISYKDNNGNIVELDNENFDIKYANDTECGVETGVITISGKGGIYEGSQTCFYTIQRRLLTDATVTFEKISSQVIDGITGKAEPKPILIFRPDANTTVTLTEHRDYEVSYSNNTAAGQTGSIVVKGINNFDGTLNQTFYIGEDLENYISGIEFKETPEYVYNGKAQTPELNVIMKNNSDLVEGRDYEVFYDGKKKEEITDDAFATKAGTHTVSISGIKPYGGSMELEYSIEKREISHVDFAIADQIFTGSSIHPVIIGTDEEANTRLGEAAYATAEDLQKDAMLINEGAFTASFPGNNTEVGTVEVALTAAEDGNYTGTARASFAILPKNINDASIRADEVIENQIYTGGKLTPGIALTDVCRNAEGGAVNPLTDKEFYVLKENEDYDVTYTDNIYPGMVTMTVTGKNHYTDKLVRYFSIMADLKDAEIAPIPVQQYTGEAVMPELTVTLGARELKSGLDYTADYSNNIERGTATVTIHPVGGSMYTGSKTATFEISREISAATAAITLVNTNFVYTGAPITPAAAVTYQGERLTAGRDYTVSYSNNVNVGRASITITGTGKYMGTLTANFTIIKRSIIRCTFQNVFNQYYTTAATGQNMIVMDGDRVLVENQDYQVAYINNINPGTATMSISGMGNYGGIKTARYVINVQDMTSVSASAGSSSVKLSWQPVTGAQGYAIYNASNDLIAKTAKTSYTHKKLKSMKIYSYRVRPYVVSDGATYYGELSAEVKVMTKPSKPSVKLKTADGQVQISWKKIKGVSGYAVYRSSKKSGKYKKIKTLKKASSTKYTNKKLTRNKKYYYKVRAYKTVNGKKVYSSYSSVKSIRVK